MQAYLTALLRSEPGVNEDLAMRLADRLMKATNRMLVWDAAPPMPAPEVERAKPRSESGTHLRVDQSSSNDKDEAQIPEPPFDPYAFSVVVMLAKKGEQGLMARLNDVSDPAQLKAIADAQHIGLKGSSATAKDLRKAIVQGAKQRLADRRAAAS